MAHRRDVRLRAPAQRRRLGRPDPRRGAAASTHSARPVSTASGSVSRPSSSVSGTRSTPTTSPSSTTPRASWWARAAPHRASASGSRSATPAWSSGRGAHRVRRGGGVGDGAGRELDDGPDPGLVGSIVAGTFLISSGSRTWLGLRHRAGVPRPPRPRSRRGRAGAPPAHAGVRGPAPERGDQAGHQALARLPGRSPHGPRLRHGDPGGAAGAGRRHRGLASAVVRRSSCSRSCSRPA